MVDFTPNKPLSVGIAFALPFFILNALAVSGAPVVEMLRVAGHTTINEQILILGLVALMFVGGVISFYPAIKTRRLLVLNILVGLFLSIFSVMAGYGLGLDVYRCDILKIPNCD